MSKLDYRLNALVDSGLGQGVDLAEMAAMAARHGATLIQYRAKTSSTKEMIQTARAIRAALQDTGVLLVVNDRVDVALAAGADGVHLGRDDMDADAARRLLGPTAIIGLTVKDLGDAEVAATAPVDYACIGGVFETLSKVNPDQPLGLGGFADLRGFLRQTRPELPVGAIAGITLEKVPDIIAAGADGVAVISALFRAPDIGAATRALRKAIDHNLEYRCS